METRSRKTSKALSQTDFRLIDFRLKNLTADRFIKAIDPEMDGGVTRTWTSAELMLPSKGSPGDTGGLDLTVKLEGYLGEGREEKDRSFAVTMLAEFLFVSEAVGWVREGDYPAFVQFFAMQAFPLSASKLRQIAHEMGFMGADPDLGMVAITRPGKNEPKVVGSPRNRKAIAK